MIFRNRGYDAEVKFVLEENCDPNDGRKCVQNCEICSNCTIETPQSADPPKWTSIVGKFFMIMGANMSCACNRTKTGVSHFGHIGDGYIDLLLVRHTSVFNILKFLWTMQHAQRNVADLPFVEIYRTKQFQVKLLNAEDEADGLRTCNWNCDGEMLQEREVSVRCHAQLIKTYRRGLQWTAHADSQSADVGCIKRLCP